MGYGGRRRRRLDRFGFPPGPAGLAAVVLGILAVAGTTNDLTLNLIALLALGSTIVLTGGSLSATVLSLMRPWQQSLKRRCSGLIKESRSTCPSSAARAAKRRERAYG